MGLHMMDMIVCGRGLVEQTSDAGLARGVVPHPQITQINLRNLWMDSAVLEIQLQPKLELPGIEGGRWAAVVAAVAGALVEQPHVVNNGEAAASLKRLKRLNPSAINSNRSRSPSGTSRDTRRSNDM